MPSSDLSDLESRIAYQDDSIDQLGEVIRDQWAAIDALKKQIGSLERRISDLENNEQQPPNAPPPHY